MDAHSYQVMHLPGEQRYQILRDGHPVGEARYQERPGTIVLTHTGVTPAARGEGVGSRLVAGVLEDIRARGLRVVPLCPFVAAYIERHPEHADLVASVPMTPRHVQIER
jgi:predicted GNAT family acetyltransferase